MKEQSVNENTGIRILKIATCPSQSGKSKLTYHIGCTTQRDILFRIYANSGNGYFSDEWIDLSTIQLLLSGVPKEEAVTSFTLHPLAAGKSVNTPGFIFAALLNEGLVQPSTIKRRRFDCTDGAKFFAEITGLLEANVDLTAKLQKQEAKRTEKQQAKESAS